MMFNWSNYDLEKFIDFCEKNSISYEVEDYVITYKTKLGTWKIVWSVGNKTFIHYHLNQYKSCTMLKTRYNKKKYTDCHAQKVYPLDGFSLMKPLKSSFRHDEYKYKPKMSRIDYLFSKIENENKHISERSF